MMKKIPMVMLLCASGFQAGAEMVPALKVELKSGDSATFILSEKPRVTFSDADMIITAPDATVSYPRHDVGSMNFTEVDNSAVGEILSENLYRYVYGVFEAPGHEISIYSMSGVKMAEGKNTVSTSSLAAGVYIVKAGDKTLKIIIK